MARVITPEEVTPELYEDEVRKLDIYTDERAATIPPEVYYAMGAVGEAGEMAEKILARYYCAGSTYPRLWGWALHQAASVGKFVDNVKKMYRDRAFGETEPGRVMPAVVDAAGRDAVGKEIGDQFWYLVREAAANGFTMREIMAMNLNKLWDRKERNVQRGSGDNR